MTFPSLLYLLVLAAVAVICLVLVLSPRYDDTLLQRLGMIASSLGAFGEVNAVMRERSSSTATIVISVGVALYIIGTLRKRSVLKRHNRRALL